MKILFSFFVRFFVAFLVAKFILGLLGAASPERLLVLTFVLLCNTYLFDLLDWYYDGVWRRSLNPRELGWLCTRLSVMLNAVRRKVPKSSPEPPGRSAEQDRPDS